MHGNRIISLIIIIILLAAGITGIYRGFKEKTPQPALAAPEAPPAVTVNPPQEAPAPQQTPTPQPDQIGSVNTPAVLPPAPAAAVTMTGTSLQPRRPHSPEAATAQRVAQALQLPEEQRRSELQKLVQEGTLPQGAAEQLAGWEGSGENSTVVVEEVGTSAPATADGSKQTRYRLTSPEAKDSVLLTVSTPTQGGVPGVQEVRQVSADKTQTDAQSDAISVVEALVETLRRGDMAAARRLTTGGEVSDATLAGLCIMFEDGDFELRKQLPMRNMFSNEQNSGFLVYLTPRKGEGRTRHVGVELTRDKERGWVVRAVAPDDLLNRYEESGAAESGAFFPLVKNPNGGDSLVLYFGFDDANLSPRSERQLKIVADTLLAGKGKITISGHTDDVGSADYNRDLSGRRAGAVRAALMAHGVAPERIITKAMGKSQPRRYFHTGDTEETINTIRSENRRAEIYLDF